MNVYIFTLKYENISVNWTRQQKQNEAQLNTALFHLDVVLEQANWRITAEVLKLKVQYLHEWQCHDDAPYYIQFSII
jgi:hypothetical protein